MQVQRLGVDFGGTVTLPAAYVAEHVDLGYAVTAHRAQGITVDTSHVVVSGSTTRENFYVSMTRGRDSNIAYVALDKPDEGHAPPEPDEVNAHTVLYGVLQHTGAELSAHQMIVAEHERWSSIAQLGAEYETIAAVAQRDRWIKLMESSGLTNTQVEQVLASRLIRPAHRRASPGRGQPPRRRPTPAGPRRSEVARRRRGHRGRPDQSTSEGCPAEAGQASPSAEPDRRVDPGGRRPDEPRRWPRRSPSVPTCWRDGR